MRAERLETAVPAGTDPRVRARELARVHEDTVSGKGARAAPRPVIGDSWHRLLDQGMDPDHARDIALLDTRELEHRRRDTRLAEVLPTLRESLATIADQASNIMVVADADGRVLWREGSAHVRRWADGLGFLAGSSWREDTVGTNAIGTALVVGKPMQVYSAEHFLRSHHPWTCSAAPVRDPRDGDVLGVVDLSGPVSTVHPSTLALATTAARLAEAELRQAHHAELERLRAVAAPMLAGHRGRALVADPHGWVAAASGIAPVDRVLLPEGTPNWLPAYGACSCEPVPGGWLIRLGTAQEQQPVRAVLDLRSARQACLEVTGASGSWQHRLSPRHSELLYVLASTRRAAAPPTWPVISSAIGGVW